MKPIRPLVIALLLIAVLPATAQEEERYQPTPTTLPELIDGAGLEAIDWDVWTVVCQDGEPITHTRKRAYVEGEVVVFAEYTQIVRQEMYAIFWLYATDGRLLEFRMWEREHQRGGWADDGRWVMRVVFAEDRYAYQTLDPDGAWRKWAVRDDYEPTEDAIHESWLPLAVRYHIERGHEDFEVRHYFSMAGSGEPRVARYRESGVETVVLNGIETPCRVYEATEAYGPADASGQRNTSVSFAVFTSQGHFVREWYTHSPPETDHEARCEPEVLPEGFADFPFMLEAGIGDEVFGVAGSVTVEDVVDPAHATEER